MMNAEVKEKEEEIEEQRAVNLQPASAQKKYSVREINRLYINDEGLTTVTLFGCYTLGCSRLDAWTHFSQRQPSSSPRPAAVQPAERCVYEWAGRQTERILTPSSSVGKLVTLLLCLLGLLCTTTTCELAVACRYSFYFFYFPWALLSLRTLGLCSSILFFFLNGSPYV